MSQLSESSASSSGNTKPMTSKPKRISSSKSWCFTHNNYTESELSEMAHDFEMEGMQYIIGREVGESGTPHLQGYVTSDKTFRPMEKFSHWNMKPHWEKCRGSRKANIQYCRKEKNYYTNIDVDEELEEKNLIIVSEPYGWQNQVIDIIDEVPDNRTIHWFWEPNGNIGKSSLVKYLCHVHGAQVCAGKASDMKCQIASLKDKPPKIVIFDVPRSNLDYISYTGIEEIKNGCFSSPKYESKMYIMNSPHVIVFANEPPIDRKLSKDRWHIVEIDPTMTPDGVE